MNYEELVHEFLDGSLESGKEEQLFLSFSTSEDLRTELKQQLAIRDAIRSDIKALTPRAESTMRIFTELGFTVPLQTTIPAPINAPLGFWSRFTAFISKNNANFITGIASSVSTAIIMMMLFKGGIFNFGGESDNSNKFAKSIPVIDSRAIQKSDKLLDSLDNNNAIEPKVVYKYIYLKNDLQKKGNQSNSMNDEDKYSGINTIPISLNSDFVQSQTTSTALYKLYNKGNIENTIYSENLNNSISKYNLINPEKISHFTFEANSSTYFYNNQERISQSNTPALNNTSFALKYKFNEEVQVGFDCRWESFYQKFEGFESNNLFAYEQNPNLFSVSLILKYAPEYLSFGYSNPFIQTSLGGTIVGPVGRIIVGTKLDVFENYYILLSGDYSVLGFTHNNNWFFASKYGLHAGIGIGF